MNIKNIDAALANGRRLMIVIEFVRDFDGEPVIDVSLSDDGRDMGGMIGATSLAEALEAVNARLERGIQHD